MTLHPRRRRPDDWKTSHARARTDLSDRLDGLLDPSEAGWLDEHLASCAECRAAAAAYEADRDALHSLGGVSLVPPRDLWARTAAAIEHESRSHDQRAAARRPRVRSMFAAALVVAVAVGVLSSSQLPGGGGRGGATPTPQIATASTPDEVASATSIPISQKVHWIRNVDGKYSYTTLDVREVCPSPAANQANQCSAGAPSQDQPVGITSDPVAVIGSSDGNSIIVVGGGTDNSINVLTIQPTASPVPSDTAATPPPASAGPSAIVAPSASAPSSAPTAPASVAPSATPSVAPTSPPSESPSANATGSAEPTPSAPSAPPTPPVPSAIAISPSPSAPNAVEIARDVVLVGQSAAYSPSGDWFAFTARPVDGSTGPDIYVWRVGDPTARRVTTDHQSTFGSWIGDHDVAVGSRVVDAAAADSSQAPDASAGESPSQRTSVSFLLDPSDGSQIALPQTGRTWKPSVDPTGRVAVYWTGTLSRSPGDPADVPEDGSLVVGDWATGDAAPSDGPGATPADQPRDRHETVIASSRIADWDARWEPNGTKLAVWVADPNDPNVGNLSLYSVTKFDGRVDLKKPLLDAQRAKAGFSISNGKLVWAEPAGDGQGANDRILVLAWTDQGVGTVETAPANVVVVR